MKIEEATQRNCKNEDDEMGFLEKVRLIFSSITVEPVMLFFFLPSVMSVVAVQNLNLEKACRVNLKLNETICDGLAQRNSSLYNRGDEETVQKLVASMNAWKNIIQSIIPATLLMFLGSWSDRHTRRKPCIILPLIGEVVTCTGLLFCTYFFYELSMELTGITESLPTSLTGGWSVMYMGVFSYISGISSVETRTIRIGAVNIFSHVSYTIGIVLSGILYRLIGFYGVFTLALSMYLSGLFYGIFRIKEYGVTKKNDDDNRGDSAITGTKCCESTRDFFNVKHVAETLKIAFKPRQKNWRLRICMIMLLVMLVIGPTSGEFNVIYLFVRYKFNWDEINFSLFYTYYLLIHMTGTIFSLAIFTKYLKWDDALLGVLATISKVASSFIYAFAPTSMTFCLGVLAEVFNGTAFIALRSIISKLVPADELGRVNSLFGVSEALMPVIYGPLYSLVYKWTIHFLPGAFFIVGGFLTVPAVIIFFWLYTEHRRDAKEQAVDSAQAKTLLQTGGDLPPF